MASVAKEIIRCHYSVQPYRDAFHGRNRPHYLLCYSFLLLFALSHIYAYMFRSSCDDCKFVDDLFSFTQVNRTTILTDTQKIYPTNLKLSIQPYKITSNKPFPICFAAPQFLMPLLQTESTDNIGNCNETNDTSNKQYWLNFPSFFGGNNNENECNPIEDIDSDDPFETMRLEDLWQSLLGYQLDPQCIIRIDTSANAILKKMKNANIELSQAHQMLCNIKNSADSVMKPSFIVINPDNGMIYINTLQNGKIYNQTLYPNAAQCYTVQNTLKYRKMDSNKFKTVLESNENIQKFLDGWSGWMFWVLLFLIGIIFIVNWFYALICALFEGFIATIIVWIIMIVLKCFGTFKEFDNASPTFKQIWRINLLICVPDFTFVRLMEATSIGFYSMIAARVVLTLLLIIDVYQHDPPNIRTV